MFYYAFTFFFFKIQQRDILDILHFLSRSPPPSSSSSSAVALWAAAAAAAAAAAQRHTFIPGVAMTSSCDHVTPVDRSTPADTLISTAAIFPWMQERKDRLCSQYFIHVVLGSVNYKHFMTTCIAPSRVRRHKQPKFSQVNQLNVIKMN